MTILVHLGSGRTNLASIVGTAAASTPRYPTRTYILPSFSVAYVPRCVSRGRCPLLSGTSIFGRLTFRLQLQNKLEIESGLSLLCSLFLCYVSGPAAIRCGSTFSADIGNLHPKVSVADLEPRLIKYGTITNLWVAKNPPGASCDRCLPPSGDATRIRV